MIVWTVANQKGGVGKTTTVVSLAGILAQRGQGNRGGQQADVLESGLEGHPVDQLGAGFGRLEQLVQGAFQPVRVEIEIGGQGGVGVGVDQQYPLATLDRVMGNREGMGLVLKRALLRVQDQFDYVLIDCPPVLGVMMVNALAACDRILVPVQTEFLALKGLERMMKTFEIMQRSKREKFRYTIIPTMFDKRTRASLMTLQSIKEQYGEAVWNAVIPIDTKFRDASLVHIPPSIYAPGSRGTYAYETLLNHLDALERQRTQEVMP